MKHYSQKKLRVYEAICPKLPDWHTIVAICPETGPYGEEQSVIYVLPGDSFGVMPVLLPYSVPVVMEAIAYEAGWDLSTAAALGRSYAPQRQGDILPLWPIVFVSIKMRCRMTHDQNVWGYVNVSLPIDAIVPGTKRQDKGTYIRFLGGQTVYSPWRIKTVKQKLRLAKSVGRSVGLELAFADAAGTWMANLSQGRGKDEEAHLGC